MADGCPISRAQFAREVGKFPKALRVRRDQGKMKYWEKFRSFKERGEWVELQFMAAAAQRRFAVSKPWGDTKPYDVGIEHEGNYLRVQVKSTTMRSGAGYLCQFHPNHQRKQDYSLKEIDVFAAFVIPENVWYLIPLRCCWGSAESGSPCCALSRRRRRRLAIAGKGVGRIGSCWSVRLIRVTS